MQQNSSHLSSQKILRWIAAWGKQLFSVFHNPAILVAVYRDGNIFNKAPPALL